MSKDFIRGLEEKNLLSVRVRTFEAECLWSWGSRMESAFMWVHSVCLQEGEEPCILMWAKRLSVSILRRGRWEEYDLTPATFGKDVNPKVHGSSCDKNKARYLRSSTNRRFQTKLSVSSPPKKGQ